MLTACDTHRSSQSTSPVPLTTLADALDRLERDRGLPDSRRKKYAGAVRTMCSILCSAPEALPADLRDLELRLREIPSAAHGRSRKTIANMRSTLKAALLHCADAPKLPPRGMPLRPAWATLRDALTDLRLKNGLSRLMRLASHQGVDPEDMSDAAFQRLVQLVQSVNWGRDVLPFERDVPRLWNEAVATVPGWPGVRLRESSGSRRVAHLPLSALPVPFQQDVEAYLSWAAGGDPFAVDAPTKALKSTTLHLRREQLRIAASTLAQSLGGPTPIVSLAVLVQPENVKTILRTFVKSGKTAESNAFARGLCMTLKAVAKAWVKASPAELEELARVQRLLGSEPAGLTKKNRSMLRHFEDPRLLAKLLELPDAMRKSAQRGHMSPARRLQKIRIALAIDILLVAPMRLQNLAGLQIGRQLQWPNGRSGTLYVVLDDNETKNEQPLEYPLPDRVRDLLHDYLDRYRQPARTIENPCLFVDAGGKPVAANTLRDGIKKAIKRELGVDVTPHQFRHLAAKIALDAHPGALGLVQSLLGHRNVKTTQKSYAGMRTREAGRFYDQLLTSRRNDPLGAR